jgi:hypothetical protein
VSDVPGQSPPGHRHSSFHEHWRPSQPPLQQTWIANSTGPPGLRTSTRERPLVETSLEGRGLPEAIVPMRAKIAKKTLRKCILS